ncbi:MAG: hypothetical protein ACLQFR_07565 [Streptosporangiaceae bacterium]
MTWELAAADPLGALSISAGRHVLATGGLSARVIGGLLLLALILAAVYLGSCLIWPYAKCTACLGSRRNPGSNRRRHGRCKACRGTGERLGLGTRIIGAWRGGRWPK